MTTSEYPRLRKRTHTPWGAKPYHDYVCMQCETIVLQPERGCQNCQTAAMKKAENLKRFLESRKEKL